MPLSSVHLHMQLYDNLQVQSLIEQEVRSTMERQETKLKGLIETIEHLDREINYESTIQKLEVGGSG